MVVDFPVVVPVVVADRVGKFMFVEIYCIYAIANWSIGDVYNKSRRSKSTFNWVGEVK